MDDIPGLKPVSTLLAAAKLSSPAVPIGSDIFADPKPSAILVNISKPVGYAGGRGGILDLDDFDEVGRTGMFKGGVSNLCGDPEPIADETLIGGTPAGLLTICCSVLTEGKLGMVVGFGLDGGIC